MSVHDRAYALAGVIKESDEYREYVARRDAIKESEGALGLLRDYRRAEFKVRGAQLLGQEPPDGAVADLTRIGGFIEMHRPLQEFLQAEYRYAVLIADIQKIIGEAVDVWLDLDITPDEPSTEDPTGSSTGSATGSAE
jgi:cell fate (sporulation/competence/biofilm development) regulator YlbF (YheA/YmcA/DUF963 family)